MEVAAQIYKGDKNWSKWTDGENKLARDFGYKHAADFANNVTKKDAALLELIKTSPHGPTLHRVIKAKRS